MTNAPSSSGAAAPPSPRPRGFGALLMGALGIVFGDIGTSPLYALREVFAGPHPLPLDRFHMLGTLSLVFWSLIVVVTLKYVVVMMRADNRGEGGAMALQALISHAAAESGRLTAAVALLGVFAVALFYGDSIITPAISVLAAVEGVHLFDPQLTPFILPAAVAILVGLFLVQRQGTNAVGAVFGPVMVAWFVLLMVLGIRNIALAPEVLRALMPHHAISLLLRGGPSGFLSLGSVVLVVAGCEALHAEMGHFGRLSIRLAWYLLVLPALVLIYFGQGALLLVHPEFIDHPFFHMVPAWAGMPLVGLTVLVAVIASQAVISGAFSMTRQAIQLGYLPRMAITHTSAREIGQVYVSLVNWLLMLAVGAVTVGFGGSSELASAYGVAMSGTMLISTMLLILVMTLLWGWRGRRSAVLVAVFLLTDAAFFLATATKIPTGGWVPLAIGIGIFVLMVTWQRGRLLLMKKLHADAMPVALFLDSLSDRVKRVPGTAIFLTSMREGIPTALLHNLKHNKIIHERVVILTVILEEVPVIAAERRLEAIPLAANFHRLILRYGFMEETNIPKALAVARSDQLGFFYEPMSISYFLSRETLVISPKPGMAVWREQLFAGMQRSATSTMDFFHLPSNRVVELGTQVEI